MSDSLSLKNSLSRFLSKDKDYGKGDGESCLDGALSKSSSADFLYSTDFVKEFKIASGEPPVSNLDDFSCSLILFNVSIFYYAAFLDLFKFDKLDYGEIPSLLCSSIFNKFLGAFAFT